MQERLTLRIKRGDEKERERKKRKKEKTHFDNSVSSCTDVTRRTKETVALKFLQNL
jgi:hypothetical protein